MQINDGIDTYAYMAILGNIKSKGKILDILTVDEVKKYENLVPEYYRKDLNRCVDGILLESIVDEEPDIINELQRIGNRKLNNFFKVFLLALMWGLVPQ